MSTNAAKPAVSIRELHREDIPAVHALAGASPSAAHWSAPEYERFLEGPESAFVLAAGGQIIGFVALTGVTAGELEILNLFVDTQHRREGHGSQLLRCALESAKARGAREFFLEVRESNTAAIGFYEQHGFVRNGRRPNYYRNPDEPAVLMMRKP